MLVVLICGMLMPFMIYGVVKRNLFSIKLLLVMCVFQNFILVLISPYIDKTGYNILVLVKEIYVFLTMLVGLFSKPKIKRMDLLSLGCLGVLFLCMIIHSEGTFMQVLVSVRQLYLPFIFFLFARQIKLTEAEFYELIRFFVSLCIICALFGFVELLIGDSFWQMFHYEAYSKIKIGKVHLMNGYYNSPAMYSYDFYPIIHRTIRRMSSFLVDPVILGQILSLGVLFLFSVKGLFKHQWFWFVVVSIALILTLAKGGIIIAAITGSVLVKKIYKQKQVGNLLLGIGVLAFVYALVFSVEEGTSGGAHLDGLMDYLVRWPSYPLGSGIGSAGNLAIHMAGLESNLSGESFVGTVIGQLGIGIFMYVWFAYRLYKSNSKNSFGTNATNQIIESANVATLIMFLTSFINNTAISFTSCYIFFIVLGIQVVSETEVVTKKQE